MTKSPSYLDELNEEQKAAVVCGISPGKPRRKLPLLIDAGPGSGKTRTLAACIAYTVDCGGDTDQMMICSFTRKTASELIQRVSKLRRETHGGAEAFPYAGTFHSVALKLLRRFGEEIGLRSDFTILGRNDQVDLLASIQGQLKLGRAFPRARDCADIFSFRRNARISLAATLETRHGKYHRFRRGLAKLLARYKAAKKKQNLLDYDDLLFHFARLLRHPSVRAELCKRIKFMFVDEFQDTSRLQWQIVKSLTPRGRGMTVVGDDAQAIYGFRAATVSNIRGFEGRFKRGARKVTLVQNYRSTRRIVAATNTVIESAGDDRSGKKLWSKNERGPWPRLVAVRDDTAQAKYVIEGAKKLLKKGVAFKDQAVLFRTSREVAVLEDQLAKARVPYVKWGGRPLLEKSHVRDFIALLRWFENPRSQLDASRVFQKLPGVGRAGAKALFQQIDPLNVSRSLQATQVPQAAKADWGSLVRLIVEAKRAGRSWQKTVRSLRRWFLTLDVAASKDLIGKAADIERFVTLGEGYSSCGEFLSGILIDPTETEQPKGDALILSTIHSAKGHEFKAVTVLSVVEGSIPSNKALSPEEVEEEQRVLYVGMTRAKKFLHVIVPQRLSRHSNTPTNACQVLTRSRFLDHRSIRRFRVI